MTAQPADAVLDRLAQQLGSFASAELAELAGQDPAAVEIFLSNNAGYYERIAGQEGEPDTWLIVDGVTSPAAIQAVPDPAAAAQALHQAKEAVRQLERGAVQDEATRQDVLRAAGHHAGLSRTLLDGAPEASAVLLRRSVTRVQRRLRALQVAASIDGTDVYAGMRDWTVPLHTPGPQAPEGDFHLVLDRALHVATRQAASPGAVFGPARALLAVALPSEREREALAADLGDSIRRHAMSGNAFRVVALGFVAAVIGIGSAADALVAAVTTPAFRRAADRGALRMVYAALGNLARPGGIEPILASECCAHLLRRARPGQDEMELLAPAALQANAREGPAPMVLIAEWLAWERDGDPADEALSRLGAFARNIACSLDAFGFDPLEQGLRHLQDQELGVTLVEHLTAPCNDAVDVRARHPPAGRRSGDSAWLEALEGTETANDDRQYGARARRSVSQVNRQARGGDEAWVSYLTLRPNSMVAEAINRKTDRWLLRPDGGFTAGLRRQRHGRD